MNLIQETPKLQIFKKQTSKKEIFYRLHKEDENKEYVIIYEKIDDTFIYPLGDADGSIRKIIFIGFEELPAIVNRFGYGFEEVAMNKFFKYSFRSSRYDKIVVYDEDSDKGNYRKALSFNLGDLDGLKSNISIEQRACNDTKRILIKNFLGERYPDLSFSHEDTNNNKDLILRNLNPKLIEKLTADEIDQVGKFYVEAAQKYVRPDIVRRMVKGLQKNAQLLSLQEIIGDYQKLLEEDPAESKWQAFFDKYITLFDNRYVGKLGLKNIATGVTKYPDIILVDIYGYVDFYELKKCSTPILQFDSSHKTYYWSKELSMAIAQVADYMQKAKDNGLSYAKAIREQNDESSENNQDISIINPRAIIVVGNSASLDSPAKQNQFKTLRESLKDIEFVLYDELLGRLKNLLEVVKLE